MHCVSCGHDNRAQARFCDACGAALAGASAAPTAPMAPSPPARDADRAVPRSYTPAHLAAKILTSRSAVEGERKQVTVLFCDLANSTELARRLGAEAMHETLNAFFELALAEVHAVEGTINQFLGDGFMALFGAPLAHEDHVRRALHSALAINQRLREAAAGSSRLALVQVRMGLNTGPVVVGRIGDNLRMDYTAIGDTTNVAARLQGRAEPGGICVSAAVQSAAQGYFEFADQGLQALKGIAEPVRLYGLVRERVRDEPAAARTGIASPLVGRDAELADVRRALDDLLAGRGGIVVVQGDPGAGKSRLLAEVRRRWDDMASSPGAPAGLWLEGRSLSFGRSLSYWPFIEMLKRGFAMTDDDAEALAYAKLERGLQPLFGERTGEVLPYMAALMALPPRADHAERLKYLDGPGLKRQVFLCMRQLTEQLARRQPVVLVLEDWHWADSSSIELAEHLLPLTLAVPVLMVFPTRRQTEGGQDAPVGRVRQFAVAHPEAALLELLLLPLTAAHSAELVANLVGPQSLPASLREQILRKTEGNPFFIEEVIRSLVSDGVLARAPRGEGWQLTRAVEQVQLPDTLQALILARIDRLDDDAKQALKLASVIGRSFIDRVLAAISEAREQLHLYLAELQQAELIREKHRLPELEYIFKHALVQEATYGSILAENRRQIHRRVAQAIEGLFPDRLDEFASLLAHHYTCAEDWPKAQEYLFKAGDQAGRMAADAEALEHLRQAEAAYLKAHGDKLQPLQRAALARKVGAALFGTGRYEDAHAQMRQALAHLGVVYPTTRAGVARAVLRYLALHLARALGRRLGLRLRRRMDLAVATELSTVANTMAWTDYFLDKERMLLDSLLELHAGESSLHALAEARGLSAVGFGLMTFGARGLARRYHHRAQAEALRSANASAIAFAWMALAFVDFYDGQWEAFEDRMGKAVAGFRDSGDLHRWGSPAMMVAWVMVSRGRLHEARERMLEVVQVGTDAGDPQVSSWGLQVLGRALLLLGPVDDAERVLREGRDIARRIHSLDNLLHLQAMLVQALLLQGRLAECAPLLSEAHETIERERMNRDFDRVEVLVAEAMYRLALLQAAAEDGRAQALPAAQAACGTALACARRMPLWLPGMLRLQGRVHWLAGDAERAEAAWQESLGVAARFAFPVERALTLLDMGECQGRAEFVEQAVPLLREAGAQVPLARCVSAAAAALPPAVDELRRAA